MANISMMLCGDRLDFEKEKIIPNLFLLNRIDCLVQCYLLNILYSWIFIYDVDLPIRENSENARPYTKCKTA